MAIITISRGTFSGGKIVAEKLAARLSYCCLSREDIIKEAAQLFGIEEIELSNAMTEAPNMFRSDLPISAANVNYFRYVLLTRLRNFELVFHGYAGHLLLNGVKKMLRVRIIAGLDYRIKSAMAAYHIDREKAVKTIQEFDSKRNKWAQTVLGVEWNDSSLYDVAYNLDFMSVESVVNSLVQLVGLDEFTVDQKTQNSIDDLIINSNVWAAITQHRQNWSLQVHVAAKNGQVTLYGDIASRKYSDAICSLAGSVDGVTEVINKINVGSKWLW